MVGASFCASHSGYTGKLAPEQIAIEDASVQVFGPQDLEETNFLLEITDAKAFAKAVLESQDFREYVIYGLRRRDLPPTVLIRLMDILSSDGWGKPVEKLEIRDTTNDIDEMSVEECEAEARRLIAISRKLRGMKDESQSVH